MLKSYTTLKTSSSEAGRSSRELGEGQARRVMVLASGEGGAVCSQSQVCAGRGDRMGGGADCAQVPYSFNGCAVWKRIKLCRQHESVLHHQCRALQRGRMLHATQATSTRQSQAVLGMKGTISLLVNGNTGLLHLLLCKDTHKTLPSNSPLEVHSICSVGFPRGVWHHTVQLYLLGQGDNHDLCFRQAGTAGR